MNPPAKKRLMASPQEWLDHALSDLKLAKLGKEDPDILPEHQLADKVLGWAKALISKTIIKEIP